MGRIRLDRDGMNWILAGGGGVAGALQSEANQVAAKAQALAPVDTGAYRDSIHTRTVERRERSGTRRMVVQVVAGGPDVEHARQVERQQAVLSRALGASSGRRG